jgi:hypothetical protein
VCAESYQVVGALADGLGVFNDTKTIKALDNLSAQMLVHTDVLPFSVESSTLTVKLPESSIGEAGDFISHAEVVSLRDLRNLCDRAGITLVVGSEDEIHPQGICWIGAICGLMFLVAWAGESDRKDCEERIAKAKYNCGIHK